MTLVIRPSWRYCLVLILSFLIWVEPQSGATQDSNIHWREPNLITLDPNHYRVRPFVVSDSDGNLHAVWHEKDSSYDSSITRFAIYYSFWDGYEWSEPIDFLVTPIDSANELSVHSMIFTNNHIVIVGDVDSNVIMARVSVSEAQNVHNWTSTWAVSGTYPTLAVSPGENRLCLAYMAENATVLSVSCSLDYGQTWDAPILIWSVDKNTAGSDVESLISQNGLMHLVWTERTSQRDWNGEAIWHAVFDPKNASVASVREIMRSSDTLTLDDPAITECPNGQIHIFWNNGVGTSTGRFHQYSGPEGVTWSKVTPVFPGLSGLTSKAGLVCDQSNRVHLITAAAGFGTSTSPLRYATWSNDTWSDFITLWEGKYFGERPSMVMAGGNQLHVIWDSFRGTNQIPGRFIAHAYRIIDIQQNPNVPADDEAVVSEEDFPAQEENQPLTKPSLIPETLSVTPTYPLSGLSAQENKVEADIGPVLISTTAAFVLVTLVVFWRSWKQGRI